MGHPSPLIFWVNPFPSRFIKRTPFFYNALESLLWEMEPPSDGFLLTLVTTMLARMSSNAHNLDACSFLRSAGRSLFTFFIPADVPQVLIADATSFEALASILDHVTKPRCHASINPMPEKTNINCFIVKFKSTML